MQRSYPAKVILSSEAELPRLTRRGNLGTVTHYYTRTTQDEEIMVYVQNQDMGHSCGPVTAGEVVSLYWKPENLLILEAD